MSGNAFDYDLLVIGSGPAGQRAAIQGAKLNKKVAIVERRTVLGGCSVNLGTIPSKTLREAALELCGYRSREFYGASYTVKQHITMQDLLFRTDRVIQHEIDVTRHQLMRNNVELIAATACFVGPNSLRLDYVDAATSRTATAKTIVIAAGAETTRAPNIPFDGERIFTSDDVLQLDRLPRTLAVVGAGVIGCEYASIFAALGVRVTLIDKRDRLLPFVDHEIVDEFCHHLREDRVTLRLNESVGRNEEELSETSTPYEIGKARYKEIARGQILGDVTGLLKLIFHSETRQLLGVHIIGEGASELIHIGQAVLSFGGKIDYFIETVFNYPTLAECYKVAAFDGINRLGIFEEETIDAPPTA